MNYPLNLYWSLRVDFIDAFKSISYKGIPIALIMDFNLNEVRKEIENPQLADLIENKISGEQIHNYFDHYIKEIEGKIKQKTDLKTECILLYEHLLRFPSNILEKYFDPNHTLILTHTTKGNRRGINKVPLDDYIDDKTDRHEIKDMLLVDAEKIFAAYNNHPVYNKAEFKNKFLDFIPPVIDIIDKIDNFFSKTLISCVIIGKTGGVNPINRILPLVAAKRGIPSICMQHGLIMSREDFWLPVFTSKLGVYGEYEKEWYIKRGVKEEKIEIIGHPRFDDIFEINHMEKSTFQESVGLDKQKKCVLIATQPMKFHMPLWSSLIDTLLQNQDIEIIIKPHPVEVKRKRLSKYKAICAKYPSVKLLESNYDLYDILANTDMVVINSTTVGLEALLFDKPLFILTNEERKYYESKLSEIMEDDPGKLAQLIIRFIGDEVYRKELNWKRMDALGYYYPQRLAGEKLVDLINRLTGEDRDNDQG